MKNVIFECTQFNKRNRLPDESIKQFITEIHRIAESCDFGVMRDELIQDRLMVGICDNALLGRLQMETD